MSAVITACSFWSDLASTRPRRLRRKLHTLITASSIAMTIADPASSQTPNQAAGVIAASFLGVGLFDAADRSDGNDLVIRCKAHDDHALCLPADLRDRADRR